MHISSLLLVSTFATGFSRAAPHAPQEARDLTVAACAGYGAGCTTAVMVCAIPCVVGWLTGPGDIVICGVSLSRWVLSITMRSG